MKPLTIITNFGGADVGVPLTTLSSLEMLKDAVRFEKADVVRVMGGGDPLHEIDKHYKYYGRLFRYCRELDIPVELHTAHVDSEFPYGRCQSVTYYVRDFDTLTKITRHMREWVRVDFIVGKGCTLDLIDKVADYCQACKAIHDICFRVDADKGAHLPKGCREYLRAGDPKRWTFVEDKFEQDPPYFVNGEIRYRWSDISE